MASKPTVIFGAFDRHNFGDLLIARVMARMLRRRELLFAGLAARDPHGDGGPATVALARIATFARGRSVNVIHAGGELLTCNAWEAAVMLAPPRRVPALIADEDTWLRDGRAWAHQHVGVASLAPYVLSKSALPGVRVKHLSFNAVGGVDLDARNAQLGADVLAALQSADAVSVRDRQTQTLLAQRGIEARLIPDPATLTAALFGTAIRRHAATLALRDVRQAFPHGYAAVQFSADFGDDATLDTLAAQLELTACGHGLGIVLFRAGAAPWHDDLAVYQRLAARLCAAHVRVFASLNVWDICALIAGSRIYCGSSLHGRIVAMAYALPRVNISHPDHSFAGSKHAAYMRTWEAAGLTGVVNLDNLADAVANALATDRESLRETASALARRYRMEFETVVAANRL
ncbi:polysaccharide pyruvyl transferase family protein [Paraburkholderia sp. CNPSo 3076]|uniref:polysaccharide pyruvyl transferase family protein n=1 Tax=Paraburkholderia sp. CNPSo 3076 TaxID=2940936 RepID=UPI00225C10E0|nr:polysaccharide pyruvyl transferase family protein [Paraburkholderia sp. CNPSo 3076]MCX5542791.1 polysaccharide pyruvyl transferase family protein [Paraburkholderia sp. CNPSo 3076]